MLGQIANTNAQKISAALATIGIDVYWHSVVGDNRDRIVAVLSHALGRSEAVVVTGGLGPTPDDITAEAVAAAVGRKLIRDERLCRVIEGKFAALGRTMPRDNLKQADLPEGAVPIEPEGTAPGFYIAADSRIVFVLPGVPWEMEAMLHKTVLPTLADRVGASTTVSKEILVVGLGESHTHAAIKDLVEAQSNPTIAYLAGKGQVRVRVTAKAHDADAALALIGPVEGEIRDRLGDAALHGDGTLAERLGNLLRKHSATLAVAESLTGGLLAAELTAAAGASEFFLGGIVSYATESKIEVVGVPLQVIERHGPVSDAAARALAEGVSERFGARLGLATTGVAGPEAHDGHAPGTVFVGAHLEGHGSTARLVRGYGDRANVQAIAVTAALDFGRRVVEKTE